MLHIDAIKITVYTTAGVFGRTIEFKNGLNIIRANNTSGKSSLFGALIYGLGFEELLLGRNEKALQSVFKSVVKEFIAGKRENITEHIVTQSEILLQISNNRKTVTTKRYVVNDKVKPQAIEVFMGKLITEPGPEYPRASMYVHDKGSATNDEIGFHKFLEDFIEAKLPEIINQEGKRVKLYLPLISAAHFIEQKAGWSDFFANIPYYGIREAQLKVFEYILNLDVFEHSAKKQEVQNEVREIDERWKVLAESLKSTAIRGGGELIGFSEHPEIVSEQSKPYIRFYRGDKSFTFNELFSSISLELEAAQLELKSPLNENLKKVEHSLQQLRNQTNNYEILYESLSSEISQEKERLRQYLTQHKNVLEDIQKNKNVEKLEKLGLEVNSKVGTNYCPTCNQYIEDTLLSEHLHSIPMRIDENLNYLDAQKRMVEAFINNLREKIIEMETRLQSIEDAIQKNRSRMRSLKRDLVSDDRLPSEEVIERKVVLEREVGFLQKLKIEIDRGISLLMILSNEYSIAKSKEANLPKAYHSYSDSEKILAFQNYFRSLLHKFGFTSKPVSTIKISSEKYLPVYEFIHENGLNRQIDIRFESSASDFIRAQWAYYTALLYTSIKMNGNHFNILVFDEPQQQSASTSSLKSFLTELESFKDNQIIVLASFQNSEEDFKEATTELSNVNIVDFAESDEMIINRL